MEERGAGEEDKEELDKKKKRKRRNKKRKKKREKKKKNYKMSKWKDGLTGLHNSIYFKYPIYSMALVYYLNMAIYIYISCFPLSYNIEHFVIVVGIWHLANLL